jgi:MYXO-CTERM domain-containing protein
VFETSGASAFTQPCVCGGTVSGIAANGYAPNSPSRGAWLTINDVTVGIDGAAYGDISSSIRSLDGLVDHLADAKSQSDTVDPITGDEYQASSELSGYFTDLNVPFGIDFDIDFNGLSADNRSSFGITRSFLPGDGGAPELLDFVQGDLLATHFTQSVSSAPEPGAWALMLLGLGGVGAALRTRRRKLALA